MLSDESRYIVGTRRAPRHNRVRATLFAGLWAAVTPLAVACQVSAVLDRYDLGSPPDLHVRLPDELAEVSGLAFSENGRLFAHEDERAFVYEIDPESGDALSRFYLGRQGTRGDFEGIAVVGARFFLVSSDGELFHFGLGEPDQSVEYESIATDVGNQCEVEGLAFDERTNALLLACKTPRQRDLEDQLVVFAYSLDRMALEADPRVRLPLSSLPGQVRELNPSGIEVEASTGHLVLVASQQRLVVELSREGTALAVREIERDFHRQSEGIAFRPDGALLISDEADGEDATISAYLPVARE